MKSSTAKRAIISLSISLAVIALGIGISYGMLTDFGPLGVHGLFALAAVSVTLIISPIALFLVLQDVRRRRRFIYRKRHGQCVHCGYNLTGITGACPECGKWTAREH